MALVSAELKDKLITALQNIRNNDAQGAMWDAIKSYVEKNLEVNGVYTGVMPNGSPDGLSGAYIWKADTVPGTAILNPVNFASWLAKLNLNFVGTMFQGSDSLGIVSCSPTYILSLSIILAQDQARGQGAFESSMGRLADAIVTGLKGAVVFTPQVGTSTSGGTGPVVFSNCF